MQNNMQHIFIICCLIHGIIGAPQFITFKDGKVGVNFLGYHAEAGLGGGQDNGQGLFGGLHASAGTPWGQNAAAGLGGNTNGRSSGLLYAGAQAVPDVGASAILGGDTATGGFHGAEAHTMGGVTSKMTKSIINPPPPASTTANEINNEDNAIQQIPKKHTSRRALIGPQTMPSSAIDTSVTKTKTKYLANGRSNSDNNNNNNDVQVAYDTYTAGDVVRQSLQIPIGILQSLQESLSGLRGRKLVTIQQEVTKPNHKS